MAGSKGKGATEGQNVPRLRTHSFKTSMHKTPEPDPVTGKPELYLSIDVTQEDMDTGERYRTRLALHHRQALALVLDIRDCLYAGLSGDIRRDL